MSAGESVYQQVEEDIWNWINEFVTTPNEFYDFKFAPCPYARQAVMTGTVDVRVWRSGDARVFIRESAMDMRDNPQLTTRVMAFPCRVQFQWGIHDFVEKLNAELTADNVFLNPGIAKTTRSRYPGSAGQPYFIVVANRLAAVLSGCESLKGTNYYKDWPKEHYELVVERRARMAKQYGKKK